MPGMRIKIPASQLPEFPKKQAIVTTAVLMAAGQQKERASFVVPRARHYDMAYGPFADRSLIRPRILKLWLPSGPPLAGENGYVGVTKRLHSRRTENACPNSRLHVLSLFETFSSGPAAHSQFKRAGHLLQMRHHSGLQNLDSLPQLLSEGQNLSTLWGRPHPIIKQDVMLSFGFLVIRRA
jgi:hypothetical protein